MFSCPIRMNGLRTFRWQPDTVSEQSQSLNCLGWHCLYLTRVASRSLCTTLPLKELHSSYKSISCQDCNFLNFVKKISVGGVANLHMLLFHRGKKKSMPSQPYSQHHLLVRLLQPGPATSLLSAYPETNVAQPSAV